jgi:hypothetical protein
MKDTSRHEEVQGLITDNSRAPLEDTSRHEEVRGLMPDNWTSPLRDAKAWAVPQVLTTHLGLMRGGSGRTAEGRLCCLL